MTNTDELNSDAAARLELRALFAYIWSGRRVILITIAIFFAIGLIDYRVSPKVYEATMVLSSAPGSMTNPSPGGGTLSGAARLIGLGGPSGTAGVEYTKFQSLLTSSALAERLTNTGVLQLMYPERWDAASHSWKSPSGFFADIKSGIKSLIGSPQGHDPNEQDVLQFLRGNLNQDLSLQTSLLTLSVTSPDQDFAKEALARIHREADNILRDAARRRSQRRIEYLQATLRSVTAVEQRQALIDLLNQETQTSMMIESDPNYSADIVDPPSISPSPVSPKISVVVIVSLIGGLVAGLAIHAILNAIGLRDLRLGLNPMRWPQALAAARK